MGVTSHGGGRGAGKNSAARASARFTAAAAWRMASSGGHLPGRVPQRGEYLVQPGKPQPGAQLHGPGLQRGDLVQAGLVQFFRVTAAGSCRSGSTGRSLLSPPGR